VVDLLDERHNVDKSTRAAASYLRDIYIADEDLEGERPEGFEAGPTENPEDEDVAMDSDEDLPWPEPELLQKWWNNKKGSFKTGARYLLGKPISQETLRDALNNGFQRQRIAAAFELAMRNPGSTLFECRAPGLRQKKLLGVS